MNSTQSLTRPLLLDPTGDYDANVKVLPNHILLRWSSELSYYDREMVIVKGDISYKELLEWFSSQRKIADQFIETL